MANEPGARRGFTRWLTPLNGMIALAVVIALALILSPMTASQAPVEKPALSGEARASDVMACGLALVDAERQNIGPPDAHLTLPWMVTRKTIGDQTQVSCAFTSEAGDGWVMATRSCESDDAACVRLDDVRLTQQSGG